MGFLDKVKSSATDLVGSAETKIDEAKINRRISEEEKDIYNASKEIGNIVVERLLAGLGFDEAAIAEPFNRILSCKRRIQEFEALKGMGLEGSSLDSEINRINSMQSSPQLQQSAPAQVVAPEPVNAVPAPEPVIATPAPEPIVEEPAPEPAQPASEEYGEWVEVKDEEFWDGSESQPAPAPEPELATPAPEPIVEEPAPEPVVAEPVQAPTSTPAQPAQPQQQVDYDSPLSRIQSYKSEKYVEKYQ